MMTEPTNQLTLTDAVIRNATVPSGKAQHYLHDDKLPGLALRMRATGGRTWVYLFTKPGMKGTQRWIVKRLKLTFCPKRARTKSVGIAVPSEDVFDCRSLLNDFHKIIVQQAG
jgi:hypothetical protein